MKTGWLKRQIWEKSMFTCSDSSRRPPVRFTVRTFNPRILRITAVWRIIRVLAVYGIQRSWRLTGHSSRSIGHWSIVARRNPVVNTPLGRRCHVALNTTLRMIGEKSGWLLHSTRRIGKVHVLSWWCVLVSQARVEMGIQMLWLHCLTAS